MYAIIKTGGKQYRVQQGDEFKVEKLEANVGDKVAFEEVVAVGGDKLVVGTPFVDGYAVMAEVLEQGKGDKVVIYKYKAKKDYRRKAGHRQPFTLVKITDIGAAGTKSKKAAAPKAEAKAETKKAAAPKAEAKTKAKADEKKAEKPAKKESKAAAPKVSASMKKDELLAVAKEMGVKVDAKATKADIIAAIEAK